MGFLDHSTNNIIIDAVLTDKGRELLATQGAAFAITRFTLGDDEVDYTLVQKFGRTVGKEKIIKNTPIFEAQTSGPIAIKNKLKTLSNSTKKYLPTLSLEGAGYKAATNIAAMTYNPGAGTAGAGSKKQTLNLSIAKTGNESLTQEMVDTVFNIEVNDKLVTLRGSNITAGIVDQNTNMRMYQVATDDFSLDESGGQLLKVEFESKVLEETVFSEFSDPTNANKINTVMSMVGSESGLRKDIAMTITK